jgi:PIN domain nuclease of toxin-antitoxin system
MLNLDTHILLFALEGTLSARERKVLESERWGVSSIVFWEIAMLYRKGRVSIGLESPLLTRALARLQVWPVSREVCLNMLALDFKSDPADELIAATSVTYQVPLVTRDEKILGSKLLNFAC